MKNYYLVLGILAALFLGYARAKAAEGQAPPAQFPERVKPKVMPDPGAPPKVFTGDLEGPKCPPGWVRKPRVKEFVCIPRQTVKIDCPEGTTFIAIKNSEGIICEMGCRPVIK